MPNRPFYSQFTTGLFTATLGFIGGIIGAITLEKVRTYIQSETRKSASEPPEHPREPRNVPPAVVAGHFKPLPEEADTREYYLDKSLYLPGDEEQTDSIKVITEILEPVHGGNGHLVAEVSTATDFERAGRLIEASPDYTLVEFHPLEDVEPLFEEPVDATPAVRESPVMYRLTEPPRDS